VNLVDKLFETKTKTKNSKTADIIVILSTR